MPKHEKNQGGCQTKKRKGAVFNPFQGNVWIVTARAIGRAANIASQNQVEEPWIFRKETEVGSFDTENSGRRLLLEQHTYSNACDIITDDALIVASQHSSGLFLRSAGSAWQELKGRYLWISELRLEDLKKSHCRHFWTLQEDRTPYEVTLCTVLTSSEFLSCVQVAKSPLASC